MNNNYWQVTLGKILTLISEHAVCLKLKTAALVVKDGQIIATGFNRTLSHYVECDKYWKQQYTEFKINIDFIQWLDTEDFKLRHREWSKKYEIHAESDALKWLNKDQIDNAILYSLHSPCDACAKEIIAKGIKLVYYVNIYKHGKEALETLRNNNIICIQI
jgi:dCMP deaminase